METMEKYKRRFVEDDLIAKSDISNPPLSVELDIILKDLKECKRLLKESTRFFKRFRRKLK